MNLVLNVKLISPFVDSQSLDKLAWSVLNKPKPKVEPPKPAEPQKQQTNGTESKEHEQPNHHQNQKPAEASMETD